MRRARLQHELEVVYGVDDAVQSVLVNRAELVGEIDRFLSGRLVEVSPKKLGQLRPTLESAVKPLQRSSRRRVGRVELERLLVTRNRMLGFVEDLLEQEAELKKQIELGACVGGGLDASLVERSEIVPLLVLGVHLLQGCKCRCIVGLELQDTAVEAHRLFGSAEGYVEEVRCTPAKRQLDLASNVAPIQDEHQGLGEGVLLVRYLRYARQTVEQIQILRVVEEHRFERLVGARRIIELGGG